MAVDLTRRPGAVVPSVAGEVDWWYVAIAVVSIVMSGTTLAVPVITVTGIVGVMRLMTGRPIANGWALIAAPPIAYLLLGLANGQLGDLAALRAASSTDFRVIGVIPILLYLATHRRSREDARRTLDVLATAVGGGLLLSLVAGRLTSLPQYWPFSSHHAQGFASAALLVVVVAMPAAAFSRRRSVAAIAVLTLAVSGSRSGVAAAAVALVAIPVLRMMTSQRLGWSVGRVVRIGVAAAGLAIAASLVAPRSLDRVTDTFGSVVENGLNAATFGRASDSGPGVSEADRNVAVRLSVWDELSAHFGVDRIVAVDAGTVDDLLSDVEDGEPTRAAFAAHNIFLQLGVELGWLGALIYAGVSTIGVRLLMRQHAPSTWVAMGALWTAVLVFGLTSNSLLSPAVLLPAAFFLQLLSLDPERGRVAP